MSAEGAALDLYQYDNFLTPSSWGGATTVPAVRAGFSGRGIAIKAATELERAEGPTLDLHFGPDFFTSSEGRNDKSAVARVKQIRRKG